MNTRTRKPRGRRWRSLLLDQRAGEYSRECGPAKAVAAAVGRSTRRMQQINAGTHPGVPQEIMRWIERVELAGLDAIPLVAMQLERIEEIRVERGLVKPVSWEAACERETRDQFEADMLQYRYRTERTPEVLQDLRKKLVNHVRAALGLIAATEVEFVAMERHP